MAHMPVIGRWSPRLVVSVLLGLAVVTTAGLTWETARAARSARATTDAVLGDYSTFAAWQFARESRARLNTEVAEVLAHTRRLFDGHPDTLRKPGDDCGCAPRAAVLSRFELRGGQAVRVIGEPLGADVLLLARAWRDDGGPSPMRHVEIAQAADGWQVVVLLRPQPAVPRIIGAVVDAALLTSTFTDVLASTSLLPESLVDAPSRDVFAVTVSHADGRRLFEAGTPGPIAGSAALFAGVSSLRVDASIHPDRAASLVIGGLPASRWPVALTLLLSSVVLVGLAWWQMRREVALAGRQADFVTGVSHELRTPLAQIRLYGETLLLGRVRSAEEGRRAAEVIVQEARRLGALVDTVLMFSRLRHGRVIIDRDAVDAARVTHDVVDAFRPFAAARAATVDVDLSAATGEAWIDANVFRQVLLNLLDNAVKYGPVGQTVRVVVEVSCAEVSLVVTDEGPGVPEAQTRRIWEPFWRAPGSSEGGSGLGLAIVRELATRHGGAAVVEPAPGQGARFRVTLGAAARVDVAAAVEPQPA
ncbi:MAG TPA: HAMP domain-containing sensor histidine kinase [Vicinamibacterales bacterium]|nr:HAMP domain-containing sensor histidine kinase [Vicinamibacterales bacterium]